MLCSEKCFRFAKCQHHTAYSLSTCSWSATSYLHNSWHWLWWQSSTFNYHRSVKGCCCK